MRPPAGYLGGKRNLSRRLVDLIEATPHTLYGEAFVGMGGVFLRRRTQPKLEVINDWSADVATLFRVLQRHYLPFVEMIRWQLTSRAEFERLVATEPSTLTDLERSARFLYLQRTAFGAKVVGRNFGVSRTERPRFDVTKLVPLLEDVHERLAGVVIERLPYAAFLARYDRPGALFYCDPPYWGCEGDYGPGMFGPADHAALATALKGLQAHWLLSINDVPEIRALYDGWATIEPVGVTYRISGEATQARELIVSGGGFGCLPPKC